MRRLYFAFVACALVYACSEATDGLMPYEVTITGADGGAVEGTDPVSSSSGDDKTTDPVKQFDAQTVTTGVVLLNEISASNDWVEVVNSGNAEVDISGWQVADRDKDTGEPKLKDAVTFPPGTKLGPNEYGVIKSGGADSGDPCPGTKEKFCVHAEFGVSNKNGETIFLLADDAGVQGSAVYPPDAANGDDISWGRLPNGDPKASFVITAATPGATNSAP